VRTVVVIRFPGIRKIRFLRAWCARNLSIRSNPCGPAAALSTEARDAVVIEKEIGFEFIEIRDFEPPASNTVKQGAQHGFVKVRRRGEDDVPEIDLVFCQDDAEHPGVRVVIPVIADHPRHGLFVDSNPPDFNGLADIQIAVHQDRGAVMTDVNRLTLAEEIFTAFRGRGNTNAQIQENSFTAAKVPVQGRSRGKTWRESPLTGVFDEILFQATPPLRKRIDGDCSALNSDNVRSRFIASTVLNEAASK